ncbi:hypothetical protein BDR22DRAFT_167879 [Usnea florida]
MRFLDIILWGSVLSSADNALSFSTSQASARNLPPTVNLINTTLLNVSLGEPSCLTKYGVGVQSASCMNAWQQIPRDSELRLYGLREDFRAGAHVDVGLPLRYLSGDGLCAIDIRSKSDNDPQLKTADLAKNSEVSQAAKVVLDRCVREQRIGGSVLGFSRRNLLVLVMRSYEPKAVCDHASLEPPFEPFCRKVVQIMPARRKKDVFAFRADRQGSSQSYRLPRTITFPAAGPRCALTLSKSAETRFSKASWYDIWAATVELYTMCIQRGTPGSVHGLGEW